MPDARTQILTAFLREHGLQGWFSWRPDEVVLQLGHLSYWGLSFLLTFADGDKVLFVPGIEPPAASAAGAKIVAYPWGDLACPDPFAALYQSLQRELERRGVARARVGFLRSPGRSSLPAMFAETPPLAQTQLSLLTDGMASGEPLDRGFLALYLRKTAEEIERIRLANRVALAGLEAWRAALVAGTTDAEAAARAESAVMEQTGRDKVETARAWAMVQSGPHTAEAGRFNRSSGRRFEDGDLVLIEMATCVNGYWSDLTRTERVGTASPDKLELLLAVQAAQSAVLRALAPGMTARDADAEARMVLRKAGLEKHFTHALGHHVGFRYHDPGFVLAPGVSAVLQPGMVVTVEPGAYVPERKAGARVEDNVWITGSGSEVLSAARGTPGGGPIP